MWFDLYVSKAMWGLNLRTTLWRDRDDNDDGRQQYTWHGSYKLWPHFAVIKCYYDITTSTYITSIKYTIYKVNLVIKIK